jgi:endonuclease/exonuclease/phosphatase family metal-dependent hydrolase
LRHLVSAVHARVVAGPTLWKKEGLYGNALLTRMDFHRAARIDISVAGREPRGIIQIEPARAKGSVAVLATHLGLSLRERRYQVAQIAERLEAIAARRRHPDG